MDKKNLVWVFSKDNHHLETLFTLPDSGSNNIIMNNMGYTFYILGGFVLVYHEHAYKSFNIYKKSILSVLFLSFVISSLVFFMHYWLHNVSSDMFFDASSLSLFKRTLSTGSKAGESNADTKVDGFTRYIILKDNVKLFKDKQSLNTLSYGIPYDKFNDMVKNKEIDAIPFQKWKTMIFEKHKHVTKYNSGSDANRLWSSGLNMAYSNVKIILTVAFIVASWKKSVFLKIKPMLFKCLGLTLISLGMWYPYKNYGERDFWLYYVKQYQLGILMFTLTTVLLILGLTTK